MECYYCEEEIGVGDDYIYLDLEGGMCFHHGCHEEFINDHTYLRTNDKDDFESC